jgi:acylphosphatase
VATGRVQGVFFRDSLARAARAAGVAGWVRNRPDGAVDGRLEGDPEAVQRLVEMIRQGPGDAVVADLELSDSEPEGLEGFEIRH